MKNLWTPWRLEHILGQAEKFPGCIFEAAPDQSHDQAHLLLRRDRLSVTLLNRFPYANGHLQVADLADLYAEEAAALWEMVRIIPEHLESTFAWLLPDFQGLTAGGKGSSQGSVGSGGSD